MTEISDLKRRDLVRIAGGGAALLLPFSLGACGENEDQRKIKGLKIQVQDRYGAKDYARGLELAQRGLTLARKTLGDTAPDTLYFVQAISENQLGLHNVPGTIRALKQELAMRSAAGQKEKKLQSKRTLLIKLAQDSGDTATAIDQTVIIAKAIEMGDGKDPQPTYRTETIYPPDQYRQQVEGDVEIAYNLDADGTPTAVRVSKSTPPNVFDNAALDSFRRWRFTPFIKDDEPVASTGHHFTLAFRLKSGK